VEIHFDSGCEAELLPVGGLEEAFLDRLFEALNNGSFTMSRGKRTVWHEQTQSHGECPYLKIKIK